MHGMNISIDLKNVGRRLLNERPELILSGKKRVPNLDALKLMSLILVLCLHCADNYYYATGVNSLWSMTRFVYCCGVLAIPMFFMVSGYQLLGRKDVGYGYAWKKIGKILRAAFLLYLLVVALKWLILDKEIIVIDIPRQFCLNLFQKGDYGLIWFVGGLCLVYLAYPIINRIYREKKRQFLYVTGGLVCIMSLVFFFSIVRPVNGIISELDVPQTLRLWNWLGYFCLGGLIKRYDVLDWLGRWSIVIMMSMGCFVFLNLIASIRGIRFCEYAYASVPIMIFVVSVFALFMKFKMNNRFMEEMAVIFMPAYLLGSVFLEWIAEPMMQLPEVIGAIVYVAVNAILSLTAGWMLMKIPGMKKLLRL